jgi:hypothetical protein
MGQITPEQSFSVVFERIIGNDQIIKFKQLIVVFRSDVG